MLISNGCCYGYTQVSVCLCVDLKLKTKGVRPCLDLAIMPLCALFGFTQDLDLILCGEHCVFDPFLYHNLLTWTGTSKLQRSATGHCFN